MSVATPDVVSSTLIEIRDVIYSLNDHPLLSGVKEYTRRLTGGGEKQPLVTPVPTTTMEAGWQLAGGRCFFRLAGLSGATAVALGAYGAHAAFREDADGGIERRKVFETANRYHFVHSLALMGVPLCKHPNTTGALFVLGMALFCGPCYLHALADRSELRKLTPFGGSLLILAWLTVLL